MKPCPFCGSENIIEDGVFPDWHMCVSCGAETNNWNTRATWRYDEPPKDELGGPLLAMMLRPYDLRHPDLMLVNWGEGMWWNANGSDTEWGEGRLDGCLLCWQRVNWGV